MGGSPFKLSNEYARLVDRVDAPKAVWQAIAVSMLAKANGTFFDEAAMSGAAIEEWRLLHDNGIVPQRPKVVR